MKIKIEVLKDKTPEGLRDKIQDFMKQEKVFASPILYAKSNFISFVYYEPSQYIKNERPPKKEFTGVIKDPNSNATTGQINLLAKMGIAIPEKLKKGEADKIIKENLKQ
jgi:hypothetical protein